MLSFRAFQLLQTSLVPEELPQATLFVLKYFHDAFLTTYATFQGEVAEVPPLLSIFQSGIAPWIANLVSQEF